MADTPQEWFAAGARDGFTLLFPCHNRSLDDFVRLVVPELQRRGLLRTAYPGPTLRDSLDIPVPANRFVPR